MNNIYAQFFRVINSAMSALLDLYEVNFLQLGNIYTKCGPKICAFSKIKRFIDHFGFHPRVCGAVWELLQKDSRLRNGCKMKHLLMVFYYIKNNNTESQARSRFDIDEDTYRSWKEYLFRFMSDLKVVSHASQNQHNTLIVL